MTPRVAFFTDTFAEINGVALTSRELTGFAARHSFPFMVIRGGESTAESRDGSISHLEIERGQLSFDLDKDLRHDPVLWRHQGFVAEKIASFRPDIIHVVSPGDVSEIGVYIAKRHKIPLAISWHTQLHEFGALRLARLLKWMGGAAGPVVGFSETQILNAMVAFYKLGDVLFAPNDELVSMLRDRTGKPAFLMKRGIDTELFSPAKRTAEGGPLCLGYVGRTTPEKNVRFFKELEEGLEARGVTDFRFVIVGDGSEREWLRANLRRAECPGILRGEELAQAYANMDVFTFPSRTDTFGNVVLEAFASGVPAVVTASGGPKYIVEQKKTGMICEESATFIDETATLLKENDTRKRMGEAARAHALGESWDSVFVKVYEGYGVALNR